MKKPEIKVDNDQTHKGRETAPEHNDIAGEVGHGVITYLDYNETDKYQLAKAIDIATKSNFYNDIGNPNAISLVRPAPKLELETLTENMMIFFKPSVVNTGATTILLRGLTAKKAVHKGLDLKAGFLQKHLDYIAVYNKHNDWFEMSVISSSSEQAFITLINTQTVYKSDNFHFSFTDAPVSKNITLAGSEIIGGQTFKPILKFVKTGWYQLDLRFIANDTNEGNRRATSNIIEAYITSKDRTIGYDIDSYKYLMFDVDSKTFSSAKISNQVHNPSAKYYLGYGVVMQFPITRVTNNMEIQIRGNMITGGHQIGDKNVFTSVTFSDNPDLRYNTCCVINRIGDL